jgi:hypothetical protein
MHRGLLLLSPPAASPIARQKAPTGHAAAPVLGTMTAPARVAACHGVGWQG